MTSVLDEGVVRPLLDSRTEDALRQTSMSLVVVTSAELADLPVGEPVMFEPGRGWSARFRSGVAISQSPAVNDRPDGLDAATDE